MNLLAKLVVQIDHLPITALNAAALVALGTSMLINNPARVGVLNTIINLTGISSIMWALLFITSAATMATSERNSLRYKLSLAVFGLYISLVWYVTLLQVANVQAGVLYTTLLVFMWRSRHDEH